MNGSGGRESKDAKKSSADSYSENQDKMADAILDFFATFTNLKKEDLLIELGNLILYAGTDPEISRKFTTFFERMGCAIGKIRSIIDDDLIFKRDEDKEAASHFWDNVFKKIQSRGHTECFTHSHERMGAMLLVRGKETTLFGESGLQQRKFYGIQEIPFSERTKGALYFPDEKRLAECKNDLNKILVLIKKRDELLKLLEEEKKAEDEILKVIKDNIILFGSFVANPTVNFGIIKALLEEDFRNIKKFLGIPYEGIKNLDNLSPREKFLIIARLAKSEVEEEKYEEQVKTKSKAPVKITPDKIFLLALAKAIKEENSKKRLHVYIDQMATLIQEITWKHPQAMQRLSRR